MKTEFCNYDNLKKVARGQAMLFVWPNELINKSLTTISFTDESKKLGLQPLLIDAFTASILVKVLDALRESTQDKVKERIQTDRANFCLFYERAMSVI
ncbi:hypothetical protein [Vibrio alginolyticus]|uniref:hypothetical protein n=1 Tax=Vibrio alginolyticus TaxID=663 RepID=UPI00354C8CC1